MGKERLWLSNTRDTGTHDDGERSCDPTAPDPISKIPTRSGMDHIFRNPKLYVYMHSPHPLRNWAINLLGPQFTIRSPNPALSQTPVHRFASKGIPTNPGIVE